VKSSSQHGVARRHVLQLVDFVNKNLAEPLSQTDLEAVPQPGVLKAARAFKSIMGLSLQKYVQRRRVERALQIIQRAPHTPLEQVAREVGLGDVDRLSKRFSQVVGISPSTYRTEVLLSKRHLAEGQ
jgi:transcriptional regulator GlxA family with amidase domain